jgi:hypothetical protein
MSGRNNSSFNLNNFRMINSGTNSFFSLVRAATIRIRFQGRCRHFAMAANLHVVVCELLGTEQGDGLVTSSPPSSPSYCRESGFRGLSMLPSGTQDRGFAPDRSRRIFPAGKIHSMPSFGGEVKPSVPCRSFAA